MSLRRNIAANYLGRAYSMGAIYFFVPFYIKILGMEAYGLIAFYTIMLAITALADVGLSVTFAREAARQGDKSGLLNLLSTIEAMLFATTGLIAFLFFLFADIIADQWLELGSLDRDKAVTCLRIMALSLPFQVIIYLYFGALLGLKQQTKANIVQALNVTARSGLVILPLLFYNDLQLFFLWQLFAGLAMAVLARSVLVQELVGRRWKIGKIAFAQLKPLLVFAGGMFAITIISAVNTQIDKIVVSKAFGVAEFGYYSLAGILAQLPVSVASPIVIALFPQLTELSSKGRVADASRMYEGFSFIISAIGSVGAFGLIFFADTILRLWLQHDVSLEAVRVTQLLAIGGLFLVLQLAPFHLSLANGHNLTSIRLGLVALVIAVPLLLWGITRWSLPGAATAWIAINGITFFVMSWIINDKFYDKTSVNWLLVRAIFPAAVACAGMGFARMICTSFGLGMFGTVGVAGAIGAITLLGLISIQRKGIAF